LNSNPPLESELGWAAGIVDGEGSVQLNRVTHGGRYQGVARMVSIGNTDRPLLERFARICGLHAAPLVKQRRNPQHKPLWYLHMTGENASRVCTLLLPYLFLKRERAQLLIDAGRLMNWPRSGRRNPNRAKLEDLYDRVRLLNRRGQHSTEPTITQCSPQLSLGIERE
jgi:hypothetical protein